MLLFVHVHLSLHSCTMQAEQLLLRLSSLQLAATGYKFKEALFLVHHEEHHVQRINTELLETKHKVKLESVCRRSGWPKNARFVHRDLIVCV